MTRSIAFTILCDDALGMEKVLEALLDEEKFRGFKENSAEVVTIWFAIGNIFN
jgi:hypothetical protein